MTIIRELRRVPRNDGISHWEGRTTDDERVMIWYYDNRIRIDVGDRDVHFAHLTYDEDRRMTDKQLVEVMPSHVMLPGDFT